MKTKCFIALFAIAFIAVAAPEIALLQRQLAESVGVSIYLREQKPPKNWKVRCEAPTVADKKMLGGYLAMASRELGKYPKTLLKKANLKGIVIVKNLCIAGQRRSAMPDYVNEILYLDFQRGSHAPQYQAHVIHHEFFHLLEQELNGSAYFKGPEWAKLNPKNFKYGNGGKHQRGDDNFGLVHPQAGFINRYSTSGMEEDKAEIYAALFIPAERKKINTMAAKDPHLKAKINMMLGILQKIDPALPKQLGR